jgi:vacuolar-type H+-ATPase subunit I/STV1
MGRHFVGQPREWLEPNVKADLTASLAYSISAMFVKLSLLAFYLRLSPNHTFRILTYILIFISASFGISSVFAAGLQCIPMSMLWDSTQPGHCINVNAFYFANAGIHILTEVLIYILPMHTLWKLHLPLRQKLGLCGLMGLGAM